eukprot:SAG22_NODE_496_length_9797_cov_4.177241_10_plen_84_part_00
MNYARTLRQRQRAVPGESNPFAGLPTLRKTYYSDPEARDFNLTGPVIADYARILGSLTLDTEFERWEQGSPKQQPGKKLVRAE